MKACSIIIIGIVFMVLTHLAGADQADDTTITITGMDLHHQIPRNRR
jgi:hypothetical protein